MSAKNNDETILQKNMNLVEYMPIKFIVNFGKFLRCILVWPLFKSFLEEKHNFKLYKS